MSEAFLEHFRGKTVLIMGLGRFGGGVDAAIFASKYAKTVIVTDLAEPEKLEKSLEKLTNCPNITYHLNGHQETDFTAADTIIVNPAVRYDNKYLLSAKDSGAYITSQIEIFFKVCRAKTIGITGSNGKSTTTALTAHLLSGNPKKMRTYDNVHMAGNIGNRPLLEIIDDISDNDIVVLELSSFQLQQLENIKVSPNIALITNITPNHLDYHGSFENYIKAKENIFRFQNQDDTAIFNAEDDQAVAMFKRVRKYSKTQCVSFSSQQLPMRLVGATPLPGRANLSNLAGAVAIAKTVGMGNKSIKKAVKTFTPLSHRLECVSKKRGVRWYNDSISTTPESAIVALEAFNQPKILIAGGYDKGVSFDKLGEKIVKFKDTIKAVILIGQTADKIAESITDGEITVTKTTSLQKAVEIADKIATAGDAVLLSPACASYDMFENFQHRAEIFKSAVKNL